MELSTAQVVFAELEKLRKVRGSDEDELDPAPVFDVRLDASTSQYENRTFRVRATASRAIDYGRVGDANWRWILDLAEHHELDLTVENNGLELH